MVKTLLKQTLSYTTAHSCLTVKLLIILILRLSALISVQSAQGEVLKCRYIQQSALLWKKKAHIFIKKTNQDLFSE